MMIIESLFVFCQIMEREQRSELGLYLLLYDIIDD